MSRRFLGVVGGALIALLAFPSAGHANIIDWIWSMSGPQMASFFVLHCELDWERNKGHFSALDASHQHPWTLSECRVYDWRVLGNLRSRTQRKSWLSIDTAAYTSTSKGSSGFDFNAFDHSMVVVEPIFEVRSFTTKNWMFNHGVIGASYQILAGTDHSTFDKFAIKFRPIAVTYKKKVNGSFNMRWYPNGFTPDEFGAVTPRIDDLERRSEMVWGFSFGVLWGPRSLP